MAAEASIGYDHLSITISTWRILSELGALEIAEGSLCLLIFGFIDRGFYLH